MIELYAWMLGMLIVGCSYWIAWRVYLASDERRVPDEMTRRRTANHHTATQPPHGAGEASGRTEGNNG